MVGKGMFLEDGRFGPSMSNPALSSPSQVPSTEQSKASSPMVKKGRCPHKERRKLVRKRSRKEVP